MINSEALQTGNALDDIREVIENDELTAVVLDPGR